MKIIRLMLIGAVLFCGTANAGEKIFYYPPKIVTDDLMNFKSDRIDYPYIIKYPGSWHVLESFEEQPALFFTREKMARQADGFLVGLGVFYTGNYFLAYKYDNMRMPKGIRNIIEVMNWERAKRDMDKMVLSRKNGKILERKDVLVGEYKTYLIEYVTDKQAGIVLHYKIGTDLLTLSFESPLSEYALQKAGFERMIKAFSFNKNFRASTLGSVLKLI
jgi:hypothetical protein